MTAPDEPTDNGPKDDDAPTLDAAVDAATPGPEPEAEAPDDESEPRLDPRAWLCHYTGAKTAFEHILPSGRLRMNPYAAMRDPFENRHPHLWVPGGIRTDNGRQLTNAINNEAGWIRSRHRLLSLTQGDTRRGSDYELPFRLPWSRARLWEQYAENHLGVCLVFERQAMLGAIREDLSGREFWDGSVEYNVAGFAGSAGAQLDLAEFRRDTLPVDVARHVAAHLSDFFFLKTEEWASEFEYRFVLADDSGSKDFVAPPYDVSYRSTLRYVLINIEKFPRWHLPGAARAAREVGAELLPMTWVAGRPMPGRFGNPVG